MSVNQQFSNISRADLLKVADLFGVRMAEAALADVRNAVTQWPEFAKKAGVPTATRQRVPDYLKLL